jgi:UDP-glucuronate 4-epimerase
MALFKFTKSILENEPIKIFNHGKHRRDFTYVDDIVEGILRVLDSPAVGDSCWDGKSPNPSTSQAPWRIYNIGNSRPVELMNYITALENSLCKIAIKEWLPIQPGDVPDTHADVSELVEQFNYSPTTSVQDGVDKFVAWYRDYFDIQNA